MRYLMLLTLCLVAACGDDDAPACGVPGQPCCLAGCDSDAAVCLPRRTCDEPAECRLVTMIDTRPEWMCFDEDAP